MTLFVSKITVTQIQATNSIPRRLLPERGNNQILYNISLDTRVLGRKSKQAQCILLLLVLAYLRSSNVHKSTNSYGNIVETSTLCVRSSLTKPFKFKTSKSYHLPAKITCCAWSIHSEQALVALRVETTKETYCWRQ